MATRRSLSEKKLWERYDSGDESVANDLVALYEPVVQKAVAGFSARLPSHVDKDDLYSVGLMGLYDAIRKYKDQGFKFETYAPFRVKGAVIDYLRQNDWTSRSVRKEQREIELASEELSQTLGRSVSYEEVGDYLGIPTDEILESVLKSSWASPIYLEVLSSYKNISPEDTENFSGWEALEDKSADQSLIDFDSLKDRLSEVLSELNPQEQSVLALYYIKGISLKDIGELLKVTESRACQIHTRMLDKIRESWSAV